MRCVKPGGKIIITTPNKSSYGRGVAWNTEMPPVHTAWFSERSMRFINNKRNASLRFVNFREFYRKHPGIIMKYSNLKPYNTLDKDGNLIPDSLSGQPAPSWAQRFFGKRKCGKRGHVICAVLTKKEKK
jgi:hypothetical protein